FCSFAAKDVIIDFFFASTRRHTSSVSAFLLNRSSDLPTASILASLLVRLVVLLPFQLLRLSLATPSRWTPLALSVFLHCVVALLRSEERRVGNDSRFCRW